LSISVSGLDTPVVPKEVERLFRKVGNVHDVVAAPDASDSALVVFKEVHQFKKHCFGMVRI